MARPRNSQYVAFNVADNTATLFPTFHAALLSIVPDGNLPTDMVLSSIDVNGNVRVATLGDVRIVRIDKPVKAEAPAPEPEVKPEG